MANTGGLILPDGSERQLTAEFTIGRAEDNDLTIDKPTVSRNHAVVTEEGERWFLEDRGSFNGTFVNGQRIQAGAKVPLRHGDRIGLGAESVVFSAPGSLVDPEVTTALQTGPPALTRPLSPFQRQVVEALSSAWLAGGSLDDLPTNEEIAVAARYPRRDGDREGGAPARLREGRSHRRVAVRRTTGALQDRPPTGLGLRGLICAGGDGDASRRADACHEQASAPGRAMADDLLPAPAPRARRDSRGPRRDRQEPRRPDDRPPRQRPTPGAQHGPAALRPRYHLQGADRGGRHRAGRRDGAELRRRRRAASLSLATTSSSTRRPRRCKTGAVRPTAR